MIQNYFKTLLRNMQKNKLHTAINVIGMAVAFTCTILLLVLVYYQFSFDSFHQNKDSLYQVYRQSNLPEGADVSGSMPYPAVPAIKAEALGVEKATRYKHGGRGMRYGTKELALQTQLVDADFLSMFSFPIVAGTKTAPLANLGDVVLTEYAASRIFGTDGAVGKTIDANIGGEWKSLVVSAVVADFPENSSLGFDLLARSEIAPDYAASKNQWDNTNHAVYVQLAANQTKQQVEARLRYLNKKYDTEDGAYMKARGYLPDENGDYTSMRLLPLAEVHFNAAIGGGNAVSKAFLYVLMLVGLVIVLIACFNFINLNIGLAFTRTKEMGVRKCLGAGKRQVWLQMWGESFFIVLLAMLIGVVATVFIIGYVGKTTRIGIGTALLYQPGVVFILLAILFLVSLLSSGYPSLIMSRLKTVEILKGKISLKKPGVFRNALIVMQFVIACVLISSTVVIYRQFQYLRNAPLGYTTQSLISIPIHDQGAGSAIVRQLRSRLAAQASIISVTGTNVNLGVGADGSTNKMSLGFDWNGKAIRTNLMNVDYDFAKTLNLKTLDGRDFSTSFASDTSNAVLVTESMAKQLGASGVVGTSFYSDSSAPRWTVVGVIPDFRLYSMREKAEPITIFLSKSALSYAIVRVATSNTAATMNLVKSVYAQLEPGVEFKGTYVDENVDRWYQSEQTLSRMFTVAALVAIGLSCMGLFGIAFIVIRQRVKEIGVRKVLGASVSSVAVLVTKEFIKPVLVAIAIAMPIAYWAMDKWLQDFEYRTTLGWSVFAWSALLAMIIALATVSIHAIKAAVANPVRSLRTD